MVRSLLRPIWATLLAVSALAVNAPNWGGPLRAQPATVGPAHGLRTRSPAAVLADPRVHRCRELAARRAANGPSFTSLDTVVEKAAILFELEPVFDGVASCRAALAAFPTEPSVVIPHFTAAESLSVLAFGMAFPDEDEALLRIALKTAADKKENMSGLSGQLFGFFLGSAYEYGIGTPPDRAAALKWYGVAAEAGDPVSRRELTRLRGGP